MSYLESKLQEVLADLKRGVKPSEVTVRELLTWFGVSRRGTYIVPNIRRVLEEHDLETFPDFENEYIDAPIKLVLRSKAGASAVSDLGPDPTYRVRKLASANNRPLSVKPDESIERAVSLMLMNDFSQLPVMTTDREVKGLISWRSIGIRLSLGRSCNQVRDCMDKVIIIDVDTSLFDAIDAIVSNDCVLVARNDKFIQGIVTTTDLSQQFQQLGEPFLLIGEVENYIRRILSNCFSRGELQGLQVQGDDHREINGPADLTFGQYQRLLENKENWEKVSLHLDRTEFVGKLDEVRRIRNDVMHFDPDGISESDLSVLRDFVRFFRDLSAVEVI